MKKTLNYLLAICSLAVVLTACQKDDSIESKVVQEPGLYFNLTALDADLPMTRAMDDDADKKINKLWAIYFKKGTDDSDAKYTYLWHESVDLFATVDEPASDKPYRLNKAKNTTIQSANDIDKDRKVLFITNIATLPTLTSATTLAMAKTSIKNIETVAGTSMWNGSATKYIPMYACSEAVNIPSFPYDKMYYINEASNTSMGKIHSLVRMMAKFTITSEKVTLATDADYNFKIEELSVVNANNGGVVCYGDVWDAIDNRVTAITTTTGLTKSTKVNANKISSIPTWTGTPLTQKIVFYTYETDKVADKVNDPTNCYILIKGTRTSKSGVDETGVEYMIPIYLIEKNAGKFVGNNTLPGPVLRNHHYHYTIKGYKLYTMNVQLIVRDWTPVSVTANPIPLR